MKKRKHLQNNPTLSNIERSKKEKPNLSIDTVEFWSHKDVPTLFREARPIITNSELVKNISNQTFEDNFSNDHLNSDEQIPTSKKSKFSRRIKATEKKKKEEFISQQEQSLDFKSPETGDDFERLIFSSPNDSRLWIQYIDFYLSNSEIEKARNIVTRALESIPDREEEQRFHIWMALLKLESIHGSSSALAKTFQQTLMYNNPKRVYLYISVFYEENNKYDLAEECFRALIRKFKDDPSVWCKYGAFKFRQKKFIFARNLLSRALTHNSKQKHGLITKFAQFEFKYGDYERGRTLFEQLLADYPKRGDIWSIYLDTEITSRDQVNIRKLFDRVIGLDLPIKNIKSFLKRYRHYEEENGNSEKMKYVSEKAMEYVSRINAQNQN